MDPNTILQIILVAENLAVASAKFVGEMKAQSGMSDAELLAFAEKTDADTRAKVESFLARLGGGAVSPTPAQKG